MHIIALKMFLLVLCSTISIVLIFILVYLQIHSSRSSIQQSAFIISYMIAQKKTTNAKGKDK